MVTVAEHHVAVLAERVLTRPTRMGELLEAAFESELVELELERVPDRELIRGERLTCC